MKNYIEIKGITKKEIRYQSPKGEVIISDYYPCRIVDVKGDTIEVAKGTLADTGKEMYLRLADRPDLRQAMADELARQEMEFLQRVPGIDDLLDVIRSQESYLRGTTKMMEDEYNDGVKSPAVPAMTSDEARMKYSIAASYMTILRYLNADSTSKSGYHMRKSGQRAIERMLDGDDIIAICWDMIDECRRMDRDAD